MFANSDHVKSQIEALCTEQTKIVVLDAETSPYVDVTAATMLVELRSILTRRGIGFRIALEIDPTIDDALAAYERRAQGSTE
jgi:MFS superfamily sulfate permease-like transporter